VSATTTPTTEARGSGRLPIAPTGIGRLYRGQTAIDFVGHRRIGFMISGVLILLTIVSLSTRGLNLGIDFEGGVAWDVPADELTIDEAEDVLSANGLDVSDARIQTRSSESGELVKVQVSDQPAEVRTAVQQDLAEAAGVDVDDVSVNAVSSSWGRDITDKAIRALVIFVVVVSIFISIRFEWRMAIAALVAMAHDVVISVGIYSLFGFVVTPATVIAFLTILGYSLYDSIVVFDRMRENAARFAAHRAPYADVVNVSMNQMLMRSMNTSISSMIPVLSLLIIGAGILGAATLSEFALALLVGMATGVYSSIFVAVPILASLKARERNWRIDSRDRVTGETLRDLVVGGSPSTVRRGREATAPATAAVAAGPGEGPAERPGRATPATPDTRADRLLTHPPRPRKKKRR
jgi:preprotein translocase subunit SecF